MSLPYLRLADKQFSLDAITDQLDRIFEHPDFNKSDILKKFLTYIVHETLTGNANHLKEYTIALNVLEKPVNFNPQKDCIVRIHAGRLRQALTHYYEDMGTNDQIIIGIPKGKYIPTFIDRLHWIDAKKTTDVYQEIKSLPPPGEPVTFAILPFICTADGKLIKAFNDSLCLQMCSALSQTNQLSVIAYQAIKNLSNTCIDIKELGAAIGFTHIITGCTQYIKRKLRINVQIIDSRTYKQLWSRIFECKITSSNLFDIQDDICLQTIIEVKNLINDV